MLALLQNKETGQSEPNIPSKLVIDWNRAERERERKIEGQMAKSHYFRGPENSCSPGEKGENR
jgi:hypothetical protein